jgi:hypothetical protein
MKQESKSHSELRALERLSQGPVVAHPEKWPFLMQDLYSAAARAPLSPIAEPIFTGRDKWEKK